MAPATDGDTTSKAIEISYQGWLLIGAAGAWLLTWLKGFVLKIMAFRLGAEPPKTRDTDRGISKSDCTACRSEAHQKIAHLERVLEDGLARVHQRIDQLFESRKGG